MTKFRINYNFSLFLITFTLLSSCNSNQTIKSKLTNNVIMSKYKDVTNNSRIKKNTTQTSHNYNIASKITKKKIDLLNEVDPDKSNSSDVTFEFRNERLLQGRDVLNQKANKKTKTALSAVFKMFKKNPSLQSKNLNLNETIKDKNPINYLLNYDKSSNNFYIKNVLVFLPFTGAYSKFGNKIRQAIDLSILSFGSDEIKIIYFDTGSNYSIEEVKKVVMDVNPKLILGPFTSISARKLKKYIIDKQIPMFAFTNDSDIIEKNIWSLGFSPEEQVESVISCALLKNHKKFGVIVPNDLYGKVILKRSYDLINTQKNTLIKKLVLSNSEMNNKPKLGSILKRFLAYNSENKVDNFSKFDAILISGNKNFILEIAPLLAYYDVDSKKVQILGTEKFNINEIKNEISLEKSWFPMIVSKNKNKTNLNFIWKNTWNNDEDYFSRIGFDSGILAINFLNQKKRINEFLKDIEGLVTGFKFKENGSVEKPISVFEIKKLGKIKKITGCLS